METSTLPVKNAPRSSQVSFPAGRPRRRRNIAILSQPDARRVLVACAVHGRIHSTARPPRLGTRMSEDATRDGLAAALNPDDETWAELLRLADDFATPTNDIDRAVPVRDDGGVRPDYPEGYSVHSALVDRAVELLYAVGAVTPRADWTAHPLPDHRKPGGLTADEAILAATGVVRGERFGAGVIDTAVTNGLFDAILTTLAVWYRDTVPSRHDGIPSPPEGENRPMSDAPAEATANQPKPKKAPARHVYVGGHRHGQVTHLAHDGRTRLVWNQEAKVFDVQELTWVTTGSWNKKQAYSQVKHGWDVADQATETGIRDEV